METAGRVEGSGLLRLSRELPSFFKASHWLVSGWAYELLRPLGS